MGQFAVLIFVLLPAFMADAPPVPVMAFLYAVMGLMIACNRPTTPIPKNIGWAALALIVASALAFLPASWFGEPSWRHAFKAVGEISMGSMATSGGYYTACGGSWLMAH